MVAWLVHVPITGSVATFVELKALFLLSAVAIGMYVATLSNPLPHAMHVSLFSPLFAAGWRFFQRRW